MKKTKIFAILGLCLALLAGCTSETPKEVENIETSEEIVVIITGPETLVIPEGKAVECSVGNSAGFTTEIFTYTDDTASYNEININDVVMAKYYEDETGTYVVSDTTGYIKIMFDNLSVEDKKAFVAEYLEKDVADVTDADIATCPQAMLDESIMTGFTSSADEGYEKTIENPDSDISDFLKDYNKDTCTLTENGDTLVLSYPVKLLNQQTLVEETFDVVVTVDKATSEIMQVEALLTDATTGDNHFVYKFSDTSWDGIDLSWATSDTEYSAGDVGLSFGMAMLAYTMEYAE